MSAKKHIVTLTPEQRTQLQSLTHNYKHTDRERTRARILLLADTNGESGGLSDAAICAQVGVCSLTVWRIRQGFTERACTTVTRKEQVNRKARLLDGTAEAFLVATTCSAPPEGQKRWSLHLLQDKMIQAGYCESVSHETIRQTLKKMNLNPG